MILFAASSLEGAEKIKEVVVDVDVEIQDGDLASATAAAQQAAFKKAVSETLPSGLSESGRESRIKNASNYIKSFRTLSQEERSGRFFAKINCEVILSDSEIKLGSNGGNDLDRFAIEFVWKVAKPSVTVVDLKALLETQYKASVGTIKLQRGSVWLEMSAPGRPESIYAGLQSRFRRLAELRLVKDIEGLYSRGEYNEFDQEIFEQSNP